MHDLRVFRDQNANRWWVAQVLTAGGAGYGTGPITSTIEGVFFTELGEREKSSRHASIPAGKLNRASHSSLLNVLKVAKQFGGNVPLKPANVPSAEEYPNKSVTDNEGLRWVYRTRNLPLFLQNDSLKTEYSVELVCLDDTALRGSIGMTDDSTFQDFVSEKGNDGLLSLISALKNTFEQVELLAAP